ncbi:MAG: type I methionyl aminopeptidase [Candidatus Liptonbacteria bacterium]|nr:type I methionyl aminopeptidase [Candidatus Liptonbacteria bacterium]
MKKGLIKTPAEIAIMAEGGAILGRILRDAAARVRPGINTLELDAFVRDALRQSGAEPSFLNYGPKRNPYPAALCVSANDVVVHGIPSRRQILKEGDIVGLDCGLRYRGLFLDAAVTVPVGRIGRAARRLLNTAEQALHSAIVQIIPGHHVGHISHAIQTTVERAGFNVVRDLVGHGVGYAVHEEPAVPCFGSPSDGIVLEPGMVIAIEPMVTAGNYALQTDSDGWTVRTQDGSPSAHFEHTVAITGRGPRVLTE